MRSLSVCVDIEIDETKDNPGVPERNDHAALGVVLEMVAKLSSPYMGRRVVYFSASFEPIDETV